MLYQLIEYQRVLLRPLTIWTAGAAQAFVDARSPLACLPGAPYFAAGYEILSRLGKADEKPEFNIKVLEHEGRTIPVVEQILLDRPFCRLLRFAPEAPEVCGVVGREGRPAVLLCAPLAGHHAVMLREIVTTLLLNFDVYVTDWLDARHVPLADGLFDLDENVAQVQEFIRQIGTDRLHVLAICQATVPALGAISLLASAGEPTPRSLILMGGPIDARRSPTGVNQLAARRPLAWFHHNLIHIVPDVYRGAGRKVYPSFLQYAGLAAANRLPTAHWDYFLDFVRGDVARAEAYRRECEAYNAVLDMAAEFYLDTVKIVFQEFRLALGNWRVRGESVRPQDIRTTALFTIEGELDDIAGRGQTQAAHELCRGIAASHKRHFTVRQCGHYDLFSGPYWRTEIYPIVRELIQRYA